MTRTQATQATGGGYHSPLRKAQAEQTRGLILDALTELLSERPSDEITTKDLASVAGVAERTVYRHFPDRTALQAGLTQRAIDLGGADIDAATTLDDVVGLLPDVYATFDKHAAVTRAAVLLNTDPRRLSTDSVQRSQRWADATNQTFPNLDEHQRRGLTAITRLLGSSQTWLRFREEFGMKGDESAAMAAWAMQAMLDEVRRGNPPPS